MLDEQKSSFYSAWKECEKQQFEESCVGGVCSLGDRPGNPQKSGQGASKVASVPGVIFSGSVRPTPVQEEAKPIDFQPIKNLVSVSDNGTDVEIKLGWKVIAALREEDGGWFVDVMGNIVNTSPEPTKEAALNKLIAYFSNDEQPIKEEGEVATSPAVPSGQPTSNVGTTTDDIALFKAPIGQGFQPNDYKKCPTGTKMVDGQCAVNEEEQKQAPEPVKQIEEFFSSAGIPVEVKISAISKNGRQGINKDYVNLAIEMANKTDHMLVGQTRDINAGEIKMTPDIWKQFMKKVEELETIPPEVPEGGHNPNQEPLDDGKPVIPFPEMLK